MSMKYFNTIYQLNKTKNWAFVLGTLVNCFIYLYFADLTVCICRQLFLLTWFTILTFSAEGIIDIISDRESIKETLHNRFPFLKLEFIVTACFFVAFFFFISSPLSDSIPIYLSLIVCLLYTLFTFYKGYCICRTPEVSIKYNFVYALRVHEVNSLDFVKAVLYCLYDGLKYIMQLCILVWLGPKLVFGVDYRSFVVNKIVCPLTGIQSESEEIYSKGYKLINDNPKLKNSLTLSDGITLDKTKVIKAYNSFSYLFSS